MNKNYGLYFHIPYCIHKCSYCDFYSLAKSKVSDRYINALCKEISLRTESFNSKPEADTVFFGGGTPSLLTPVQMEKLIAAIHDNFELTEDCEFTVESNPGAVDAKNVKNYSELGINRISMGVQSFVPSELNFLERIHSPGQAEKSFNAFRDAGFDNINIDLIFAIPGQTKESLKYTIDKALSLKPDHISSYSLIYEPGTPLEYKVRKGRIKIKEQEEDTELYELLANTLTSNGFEQYEVSNYAKPGKKCRHNLRYWNSEEYFGFGPSAHGFIGNIRYGNLRKMRKYCELTEPDILPEENTEELTTKDHLYESLMLELRAEGLNIPKFNKKFNLNILKICEKIITDLEKHGYIKFENNLLKLTQKGYFLGDEISLQFINKLEKELLKLRV